ncbi:MAG: pantetheine-phosphate adenylyltransferase [Nitrospinaceae bacterium]|nr:pantetheine-phosphate adenylyltransferase [Nitrospinaceae bacterium]MBT3432319.1 pantetheine-phosphate adenylyltransferase [Nitrospinaceae bacterium]MBT3823246.1 pantetheine-phosphate adenylyltransferase [Nitrospinaceae bacterium]MBT4095165.1 pantetheine-phosphate adenylyltransferase [Nitrospinaceae bacterium]MBT4430815.1 pantetheine-phosphate adenylyltransferase [Nitrospinaceae bacterium]
MDRLAIYPGTFDPPTMGHLDVIRRSLHIFDKVYVAVTLNPEKTTLFSFEERKQFFMDALEGVENLEIVSFEKRLLVEFAADLGVNVIVRGIRAVSDFEYEFQMTLMNRQLDKNIETVFLTPSEQYSFLSSSLVKEVASFGGDISQFVPAKVAEALGRRFNKSS